jgi:cytidylate kinase
LTNPGTAPVITVDGPSGVGKGMVTRWLAARLGWHRLDSGAIYRILALAANRRGIALDQADRIAALAADLRIAFVGEHEHDEAILVEGEDWTADIRAEATGGLASQIAVLPPVRAALLQRQRDFRVLPGLIADGRDMGTVVFADAGLKIFLDASVEARGSRRYNQLVGPLDGEKLSNRESEVRLRALCEEVRVRDERDRSRATAPLVAADDAIVVDTTQMKPADVTAELERILHSRSLV